MICGACGHEATETRRAVILRGPSDGVPGDVCRECADLGWLFVFGDDWLAPTVRGSTTKGRMLEKVGFGLRPATRDLYLQKLTARRLVTSTRAGFQAARELFS